MARGYKLKLNKTPKPKKSKKAGRSLPVVGSCDYCGRGLGTTHVRTAGSAVRAIGNREEVILEKGKGGRIWFFCSLGCRVAFETRLEKENEVAG